MFKYYCDTLCIMASNKCGILDETDLSNIDDALVTERYEAQKIAKSNLKLLKGAEPMLAKYYRERSEERVISIEKTQKRILECMI